ncbi:hypothetical protein [Gemmatimonas groenlandica]|uniref:Outer membrane protein beta-barrel domain-containing protein n=1 Tax=Gemmatimonas groenlandica TaxID=2732249 RepID=A0A6M4IKE2_9BACT|nr:hypothetical protein [Gemmatimonas groenlandica]QJR34338.1 hypothetical protein HKW67_01765 [Gemmatimonas groenlandica]
MSRVSIGSFRVASALVAALTTALLANPAKAQSSGEAGAPSGRGSVGVHLQISEPKGEFGRNTGNGYGFGGYVLMRLDPNSIVNLRGDVSFLMYGNTTRRIPLGGTGGLIQLDLRTTSNIVSVVTGPQLLGPTGTFTPYATALGGFSVFWTSSAIEGSANENDPFATTTNASDAVWAYGGAVGSYIRVSNGKNPVRIDLGARFLRHDDVRYLNADRVREAYSNDRPPVPIRGRADFVTYYVGVNAIVF